MEMYICTYIMMQKKNMSLTLLLTAVLFDTKKQATKNKTLDNAISNNGSILLITFAQIIYLFSLSPILDK